MLHELRAIILPGILSLLLLVAAMCGPKDPPLPPSAAPAILPREPDELRDHPAHFCYCLLKRTANACMPCRARTCFIAVTAVEEQGVGE